MKLFGLRGEDGDVVYDEEAEYEEAAAAAAAAKMIA